MRKQKTDQSSSGPRKRRMVSAATVLPLAIGLASTQLPSGGGGTIPAGAPPGGAGRMAITCTLPFNTIAQHHPIDDTCGPDGNGKPGSPQAAQNNAKNNFCATGAPVDLDFDVLHQLQEVAGQRVTFGSDASLPKDRTPLRSIPTTRGNIGEGTVARLAAFVADAHYSNVGKGESVNCKKPDKESNDIHIVLQEKESGASECDSATAEMSPHFRPDLWNPDTLNEKDQNIFGTKKHLFRFTGHLYFDGSHSPCVNGSGRPPKRSTIWEIHPVYNVEICTDDANHCTVSDDTGWQSLVEFVSKGSTETRLRLPSGKNSNSEILSTAGFVLRSSLGDSW